MADKRIPRVGTAVIIQKNNEVLLGMRINAHGAGTWACPGGHLEFMESWEDCVRREVKEETGLELGKVKFYTATNDIFQDEGKHYITLFLDGEYIGGEPKLLEPNKCEDWRWFRQNNLPRNLMIPLKNLRYSLVFLKLNTTLLETNLKSPVSTGIAVPENKFKAL